MLKRIFSVFKSKKGNSIDAIIIAPLWLFILFIISVQMNIHQANQEIEDTMQIVSRYVMISENPTDAITNVNSYLSTRETSQSYGSFEISNISAIYYKNGTGSDLTYERVDNSDDYATHWVEGTLVEITLARKTPYAGNSIMKYCIYNNDDYCYSIVSEYVYAKMTVVLTSV